MNNYNKRFCRKPTNSTHIKSFIRSEVRLALDTSVLKSQFTIGENPRFLDTSLRWPCLCLYNNSVGNYHHRKCIESNLIFNCFSDRFFCWYGRRSLYRPHHCTDSSLSRTVYLVQKLENFIQERTLYPLLLYTITFSIAQLPIADSSLAPKDTKLHPIASSIITTPPYCG